MENIQNRIAAEIRAEAARQNMPYAHLAELSGLSASAISRKIGQGNAPLQIGEAYALTEALGIRLSDLISQVSTHSAPSQSEAA